MPKRTNARGDLGTSKIASDSYDNNNIFLTDQGWVYRHYKGNPADPNVRFYDEVLVAGEVDESDADNGAVLDTEYDGTGHGSQKWEPAPGTNFEPEGGGMPDGLFDVQYSEHACGGGSPDNYDPANQRYPYAPFDSWGGGNVTPSIKITGDDTIVANGSSYTYKSGSKGTISSYLWSHNAGTDVTLTNSNQSNCRVTPTVDFEGTFSLSLVAKYNDENGNEQTLNDSMNIESVKTGTPVVDINGEAATELNTEYSYTADITNPGSMTTYSWTMSPSDSSKVTLSNSDQQTCKVTYLEEGGYQLTVTAVVDGVTITDTLDITAVDTSNPSFDSVVINPAAGSFEVGDVATLSAVVTMGPDPVDVANVAYSWSADSTEVTLTPTDQETVTAEFLKEATDVTISVTVSDTTGGASSVSGDGVYTVVDLPVILPGTVTVSGPPEIKPNEATTYTAVLTNFNEGTDPVTYVWSISDVSGDPSKVTITPNGATADVTSTEDLLEFNVNVNASNTLHTDSNYLLVTTKADAIPPAVNSVIIEFDDPNSVDAEGFHHTVDQTHVLTATTDVTNGDIFDVDYVWSADPAGYVTLSPIPNTNTASVRYLAHGDVTYTVTATHKDGNTSATDSKVDIDDLPVRLEDVDITPVTPDINTEGSDDAPIYILEKDIAYTFKATVTPTPDDLTNIQYDWIFSQVVDPSDVSQNGDEVTVTFRTLQDIGGSIIVTASHAVSGESASDMVGMKVVADATPPPPTVLPKFESVMITPATTGIPYIDGETVEYTCLVVLNDHTFSDSTPLDINYNWRVRPGSSATIAQDTATVPEDPSHGTSHSTDVTFNGEGDLELFCLVEVNTAGVIFDKVQVSVRAADIYAYIQGPTKVTKGQTGVVYTSEYQFEPTESSVSYQWSITGTGATITSDPTLDQVTVDFAADADTPATLSLTVTGASGAFVDATPLSIEVADAPVILPIIKDFRITGDPTPTVGGKTKYTGIITWEDFNNQIPNDNLTWEWTVNPNTITFDNANVNPATLNCDTIGSYELTCVVSGQAGTAYEGITDTAVYNVEVEAIVIPTITEIYYTDATGNENPPITTNEDVLFKYRYDGQTGNISPKFCIHAWTGTNANPATGGAETYTTQFTDEGEQTVRVELSHPGAAKTETMEIQLTVFEKPDVTGVQILKKFPDDEVIYVPTEDPGYKYEVEVFVDGMTSERFVDHSLKCYDASSGDQIFDDELILRGHRYDSNSIVYSYYIKYSNDVRRRRLTALAKYKDALIQPFQDDLEFDVVHVDADGSVTIKTQLEEWYQANTEIEVEAEANFPGNNPLTYQWTIEPASRKPIVSMEGGKYHQNDPTEHDDIIGFWAGTFRGEVPAHEYTVKSGADTEKLTVNLDTLGDFLIKVSVTDTVTNVTKTASKNVKCYPDNCIYNMTDMQYVHTNDGRIQSFRTVSEENPTNLEFITIHGQVWPPSMEVVNGVKYVSIYEQNRDIKHTLFCVDKSGNGAGHRLSKFRHEAIGWAWKFGPGTDTTGLTTLKDKFAICYRFGDPTYGPTGLERFDTSEVTDFSGCFFSGMHFNDKVIENWNTSKGRDFQYCFAYAVKMTDPDLSKWDVFNGENLAGMFYECADNSDLSGWDVSSARCMASMFMGARNQSDISGWNVANVGPVIHYGDYNWVPADPSKSGSVGMSDMFRADSHASLNPSDLSAWCVDNFSADDDLGRVNFNTSGNLKAEPNWGSCYATDNSKPVVGSVVIDSDIDSLGTIYNTKAVTFKVDAQLAADSVPGTFTYTWNVTYAGLASGGHTLLDVDPNKPEEQMILFDWNENSDINTALYKVTCSVHATSLNNVVGDVLESNEIEVSTNKGKTIGEIDLHATTIYEYGTGDTFDTITDLIVNDNVTFAVSWTQGPEGAIEAKNITEVRINATDQATLRNLSGIENGKYPMSSDITYTKDEVGTKEVIVTVTSREYGWQETKSFTVTVDVEVGHEEDGWYPAYRDQSTANEIGLQALLDAGETPMPPFSTSVEDLGGTTTFSPVYIPVKTEYYAGTYPNTPITP